MAKRKNHDLDIVRRLLVHSGNLCAMPDCINPIYDETNIYMGEIAHIYPVAGGGPRYDQSIEEEYINSYANLLLLCPSCHTKIDKDSLQYNASVLNKIKREHESRYPALSMTDKLALIVQIANTKFNEDIVEVQNKIKGLIVEQSEQLRELKDLVQNQISFIARPDEKFYNLTEALMEQIKILKSNGQFKAVITLLEDHKSKHWNELNEEEKFKCQLNLALIYFDLNDYASASPLLMGLALFSYKNEAAPGLISFGYLMSEQFDRAEEYALQSIRLNPDEPNGYICLLRLRNQNKNSSKSEQVTIPEHLQKNIAIQIAQAKLFEDKNPLSEALQVYASIDLENIKEPLLKNDLISFHAIAMMQSIRFPELILKGSRDIPEMSSINKALTFFNNAIDYFRNSDLYASRYYLHINRGIIFKLIGKFKDAENDFRKAFELNRTYITFRYLLITQI